MPPGREDKHEALALFGSNLRAARAEAGLSQDDLARKCALHTTEISRLERGVRDPRLTTIIEAAKGLGIAASKLMAGL